jgi:hypothetical protein
MHDAEPPARLLDRLTLQRLLQIQAAYYAVTALWPVLHFPSFRWVVGPKPDRFQFFTTTWLIAVIAAALGVGARKAEPDAAVPTLAVTGAAAFIGVELAFIRQIRKVFLLDMAAEALLGAAVLWRWLGRTPR